MVTPRILSVWYPDPPRTSPQDKPHPCAVQSTATVLTRLFILIMPHELAWSLTTDANTSMLCLCFPPCVQWSPRAPVCHQHLTQQRGLLFPAGPHLPRGAQVPLLLPLSPVFSFLPPSPSLSITACPGMETPCWCVSS